MDFTNSLDVELQTELADKLDKVSWHGHYYTCLCPFHDNKNTPSFFVYPDGFKCYSCGVWGTLKQLSQKLNGQIIRWKEDYEKETVSVPPPWKEWKEKFGGYYKAAEYANWNAEHFPAVMNYLTKTRKLDLVNSGVGYLNGWLSFPVFNHYGKIIDLVVRSTPELETNIKYATRPRKNSSEGFRLYVGDWNLLASSQELCVPFGILDMWTLAKMRIPSATGMTGKKYCAEWFHWYRRKICLIPDYGEEEEAYRLKRQLGYRARVLCMNYPDGNKDINDLYVNFGDDCIKEQLV